MGRLRNRHSVTRDRVTRGAASCTERSRHLTHGESAHSSLTAREKGVVRSFGRASGGKGRFVRGCHVLRCTM